MKRFIARFTAEYPGIEAVQYSCFTWQQNSDTEDTSTTRGHIAHNSSYYFFKMFENEIDPDRIIVTIEKIEKFK